MDPQEENARRLQRAKRTPPPAAAGGGSKRRRLDEDSEDEEEEEEDEVSGADAVRGTGLRRVCPKDWGILLGFGGLECA